MRYHEVLLQQYHIAEGSEYHWRSYEEDLVKWWLRQSDQMSNLQTVDGEHLIVLDVGQRNDGPGPDILHARIILDDFEMSGPVEMHLRAEDWYRHGHHHDIRYHDVMLHVIKAGQRGPDLPTLIVENQWLGAGRCVAQRPVSSGELQRHALARFRDKERHVKLLAGSSQGYNPLFLGMIEILLAGAARTTELQRAAMILGMENWPDCRKWRGSNLSFSNEETRSSLFQMVKEHADLFEQIQWYGLSKGSWSAWDATFTKLYELGLSVNQVREWFVNIFAPSLGESVGFSLWQGMPVFRHYGLEKKLLCQLGLASIRSVAEQQAVLSWQNNYCSRGACVNCPLTQYHHTLTQLN